MSGKKVTIVDEKGDGAASNALRRRHGSVTTTLFTKMLYDKDPQNPEKNGGVWVVGFYLLERDPGLEQLKEAITEKMLKRFVRMRSVLTLNEKSESVFEEIPLESLDWGYHFPDMADETRNWTKEDVYKFIGDLNDFKYDITKPLFRYMLMPRLDDGKAALVCCVNHAIGDGLALVSATEALYDPLPKELEATAKHGGKKAVTLSHLDIVAKAGVFLYGIFHGLSIAVARPDPPNPLRMPKGQHPMGKKVLGLAQPISLDRVKEVKSKMEGTTINDILMGVMTMTLKQFFIEEGQYHPGERVTAQFPFSMRAVGEGGLDSKTGEPHNSISYAYFDFDFEGDREEIVWKTKQQIDCIKISPSPLIVNTVSSVLGRLLPNKLMLDLARDAGNLGSAQLSNVPAPQTKVSLFGIDVLDMSFFLFSPLACYLGILSYNGVVNAAFNLDAGLNVDPAKLARHWNQEFEHLYAEVMAKASQEGSLKEPKYNPTFYRNVTKSVVFLVELVLLRLVGVIPSFLVLFIVFLSYCGLLAV